MNCKPKSLSCFVLLFCLHHTPSKMEARRSSFINSSCSSHCPACPPSSTCIQKMLQRLFVGSCQKICRVQLSKYNYYIVLSSRSFLTAGSHSITFTHTAKLFGCTRGPQNPAEDTSYSPYQPFHKAWLEQRRSKEAVCVSRR